MDKELTKLYYSIGEVANMFNVNTSLIRFWEKEFKLIQPKKNKQGKRLFTVKDIENINKIYQLVKIKGFTLEGAKNAMKEKKKDVSPENPDQLINTEIISKLEHIKSLLIKMKN